jgi:glycogen synthase
MRVFMLGWEFPPFISGGLGTACYGLTKAMSGLGTDVMFVLPRPVANPFSTHVRLVSPRADSPLASPSTEFRLDEFDRVTFRTVNAQISNPYQTPEQYKEPYKVETLKRVTKATPVESSSPPAAKPAVVPPGGAAGAPGSPYAGDLFAEIQRYATLATEIARHESFDVVHAHDWRTRLDDFPGRFGSCSVKRCTACGPCTLDGV